MIPKKGLHWYTIERASGESLVSVLEQQTHFSWKPIVCAYRFLYTWEEKDSINKLDFLGINWGMERFKHYLIQKIFTVIIAHYFPS